MTLNSWLPLLLAVLGGGSLTALITYLFLRPKTKAEAAAKRSEGESTDAKTDSEVAERWRKYAGDLERRIAELEKRVDSADRREHIVAIFVYEASNWMLRATSAMNSEQKALVGDPPKADPELFVGLHATYAQQSRPPFGDGSVVGTT